MPFEFSKELQADIRFEYGEHYSPRLNEALEEGFYPFVHTFLRESRIAPTWEYIRNKNHVGLIVEADRQIRRRMLLDRCMAEYQGYISGQSCDQKLVLS